MRTNDQKANETIQKQLQGANSVNVAIDARGGHETAQSNAAVARGQTNSQRDMVTLARGGGRSGDDNQSSNGMGVANPGGQDKPAASMSFSSGSAPVEADGQDKSATSSSFSSSGGAVRDMGQDQAPSMAFSSANPFEGGDR